MKKFLAFTLILCCFSIQAKKPKYPYEAYLKLEKTIIEPNTEQAIISNDGKSYEDKLISITWTPDARDFSFTLFNKSSSGLQIIWDECSIIDTNGKSMRVLHSGVKYIDRDQPIPPTIVPMLAKVDDTMLPSENVAFIRGWRRAGEWKTGFMFDDFLYNDDYQKLKDQEIFFRTVLVLKQQDQKLVYHFFFKMCFRETAEK